MMEQWCHSISGSDSLMKMEIEDAHHWSPISDATKKLFKPTTGVYVNLNMNNEDNNKTDTPGYGTEDSDDTDPPGYETEDSAYNDNDPPEDTTKKINRLEEKKCP